MTIIGIVALKQKGARLDLLTVSLGAIVWKSSGNGNNGNAKCPPVVHYSDWSAGQLWVLFNYAGELAVARLMDATSEAGYSDPCRRVIKPPLREVGNLIHHGGNEMKMNSISCLSNKRGAQENCCHLGEVSGSGSIHLIYEVIVFWQLSGTDLWGYSSTSRFSTHQPARGNR